MWNKMTYRRVCSLSELNVNKGSVVDIVVIFFIIKNRMHTASVKRYKTCVYNVYKYIHLSISGN